MLPQSNEAEMQTHTIYINPNFNKAPVVTHINPRFLRPRIETAASSPSIHLNPQFLQKKLAEQQQQLLLQQFQLQEQQKIISVANSSIPLLTRTEATVPPTSAANFSPHSSTNCKLIAKSSMRLVRTPLNSDANLVSSHKTTLPNVSLSPMIKLGNRKLMRCSLLKTAQASNKVKCNETSRTVTNLSVPGNYKIDRRPRSYASQLGNKTRRRSFVGRFALRRASDLNPRRKLSLSDKAKSTSMKKHFKLSAVHSNKNLQMLNINGVLYKSTRNKLQRKDNNNEKLMQASNLKNSKPSAKTAGRALIIRGTRFVLDHNGFKMTRVVDAMHSKETTSSGKQRTHVFKRIDIGGLTYVATSQNVLVRTGNHLARTHLNQAKQKSLQVLSRSLVKSNVPCAIFQRLGKCAAFERGKCRRVHDKRQVAICLKFLRGDCLNTNCLLSHNVSLSKMPVCKFYLQGICVRPDCSYLHKKFSNRTEICNDFLRGYCKLAEQCNKRHEFLCPDFEKNGKCKKLNCLYCRKAGKPVKKECSKQLEGDNKIISTKNNRIIEITSNARYFIEDMAENKVNHLKQEDSTNQEDRNSLNQIEENDMESKSDACTTSRPKLGILPAYIPLL